MKNRTLLGKISVSICTMFMIIAMIASLTGCGSVHPIVANPQSEIEVTEVPEPLLDTQKDSIYDGLSNLFEMKDYDLYDWADSDFNYQGNVWETSWNECTGIEHFIYSIDNDNILVGIMANEARSRAAVVYLDFLNPDAAEFEAFLNNLDYIKCDSEDPYYGYIATWNSFILVDATKDYISYFLNSAPDSLSISKDTTNGNYLFNLESYAYVLGIDIQDSLESLTNIDAMLTMYTNLEQCEYFGIRGYEGYLDNNGFGIIIDNYKNLKTALFDPQNSDLAEIYYLSQNGGSDPTSDPNSPMYEPPIEGPSTGTTTTKTSNYPPKVNEYMSYGYKVYKHTMCDAYYYRESFDRYILFCIDNRDLVSGAWAQSVAGSVYTSTFGVLTAIN